jgi:hypothetical protein
MMGCWRLTARIGLPPGTGCLPDPVRDGFECHRLGRFVRPLLLVCQSAEIQLPLRHGLQRPAVELDESAQHPFVHPRLALPQGYEILSWVDVTEAEREAIRVSHAREPWFAPDLLPFDFEAGLDPVTSVALRVRGQVLGWCLNHVVGDVLRFTCRFVRRDLQQLGRILLLYGEVTARGSGAGH